MRADLSVPHIDVWFWDVLAASQHNLRALCRQLEAMSRERLYSFQYQYWEAMERVPPGDQSVPIMPATVRVSEDFNEEDFAEWVVSQGQRFYYDLRQKPEQLQVYIDIYLASEEGRGFLELRWEEQVDQEVYQGWQSPFQIGFVIYQARFGKDIRRLIFGHDWDPDLPAPLA